MSSKPKHVPQPIIQIDFPAPRTEEGGDNISATVRALQFFSVMKLAANEFGPDTHLEFAAHMHSYMEKMSDKQIQQLQGDLAVLVGAARRAQTAVEGEAMLKKLVEIKGRLTGILDENEPEDGPDDGESFIPEIR